MRRLFCFFGFHGSNWHPLWFMGNVWVECVVCGKRWFPPPEDTSDIPASEIAAHSRFDRR